MESFAKSDIFFMITSVSVVLFTFVFLIVGFYIIKIVRNASEISKTLKNTVNRIDGDFEEMGRNIKDSSLFSFLFGSKRKSSKSRN